MKVKSEDVQRKTDIAKVHQGKKKIEDKKRKSTPKKWIQRDKDDQEKMI